MSDTPLDDDEFDHTQFFVIRGTVQPSGLVWDNHYMRRSEIYMTIKHAIINPIYVLAYWLTN